MTSAIQGSASLAAEAAAASRFDNVYFTPSFYSQILKLIALTQKSYLEGLIIGQVTVQTPPSSDSASKRPVTKTLSQELSDLDQLNFESGSPPTQASPCQRNLICGAILPFHEPSVFFDKNGDVDMKLIDNLESYLIAQNVDFQSFKIIGWYKLRRDTPHSMLYSIEKRVCASMINRSKSRSPEPFVFVLNTTEAHSESGTGAQMKISEQHQAFVFDKSSDAGVYRTAPIRIQNIASINLRRSGDGAASRPAESSSAEGGVASEEPVVASDSAQRSGAQFMPVKFDDPKMKQISDQIVTNLNETYRSVQSLCDSLNAKLQGLVSNLAKQELALLDSIEPSLQHLEKEAQMDSDEQSAAWKAKLREIFKAAIIKSITDELSLH